MIKKFFDTKSKKIVGICILILVIITVYHLFFRYEYKIYNKRSYPQVVKIDKLTGKAIWYVPEYKEAK